MATASESLAIAFNGAVAERLDVGGYYGGFDGGYMGGPAANNSLGGAYQFVLLQPVYVDYIKVDARVWDLNAQPREFTFDWKLYGDTAQRDIFAIPDLQSLLVSSQMTVSTNQDPLAYRHYEGVEVPIGRELPAGTHWLARERDLGQSGPIVDNIKTNFYGREMGTASVPDPVSCLTFGSGAVWAIWRRQRAKRIL